ncbi:MAG: hypothetical protein U1G07_14340 [Verrucomicrobiota bacterium]
MLPELLKHGGPMMYLLLVVSAVAVAVFIERLLHCHRAQINSAEFLNGVRNVLKRENVVEAISICEATPARSPGWSKSPFSIATTAVKACARPWKKPVCSRCHAWKTN